MNRYDHETLSNHEYLPGIIGEKKLYKKLSWNSIECRAVRNIEDANAM